MTSKSSLLALTVAMIACNSTAAADLEFAHGLYRQRRFNLAAQEYEAFLKESPRSERATEAQFFLAESYTQMGDREKSLPYYRRLAQSAPVQNRYRRLGLFRSGQFALDQRDFAQSAEDIGRFLKDYPQDELAGTAHYILGEAQLGLGDEDEASRSFSRSLAANPDAAVRAGVRFGQAKIQEQAGRTDEALQLYRALAEQKSSVAPDALLAVGAIEYQRRQFNDALQAFERLIRDYPSSELVANAELNRGLCLLELDRQNEAIAAFRSLTQRSSTQGAAADAWLYLGRAQAARNETQLALGTLQQGARSFSGTRHEPRLLTEAAKVRLEAGDGEQALRQLLDITQSHPQFSETDRVWHYVALAAAQAGKTDVVQQAYDTLRNEFPSSPWRDRTATSVAKTLLEQDQTVDREQLKTMFEAANDPTAKRRLQYYLALADFRSKRYLQAYESAGTLAENAGVDGELKHDALYLAGMSLTQLGRPADAAAYLTNYLAQTSDADLAASAARQLATALAEMPDEDARSAAESAAAAITRLPQPATALGTLADGLYDAGRENLAIEFYDRALQSKPDDSARKRLILGAAWCLVAQERQQEALQRLQSLPGQPSQSRSEGDVEIDYLIGLCQQQLGRREEAAAAFGKVMQTPDPNPYRLDAAVQNARLLNAEGDYDAADNLLASQLRSQTASQAKERLLAERAWLAEESGRIEKARELFTQWLDEHPQAESRQEAMLKLAELHYASGDYEKTLEWIRRLADSDPAPELLPNVVYREGQASYRLKRFEDAKQAFIRLREIGGEELTPVADFWLAEVAFEQSPEHAADMYQALLQDANAERYRDAANLRLAELSLRQKDWDAAIKQAEQVADVSDDPKSVREAMYIQGRALQQQARFDDARGRYFDAVAKERDELAAKAQFMIAETHLHQRNHSDALKEYLKVEILYSHEQWRSMALLQVAKCHRALNEPKEAEAALRKLTEQFPESQAAQEAAGIRGE